MNVDAEALAAGQETTRPGGSAAESGATARLAVRPAISRQLGLSDTTLHHLEQFR